MKSGIQKACEKVESLLERDIQSKNTLLKFDEFMALNTLLLELTTHDKYIIQDEKEQTE